MTFKLPDWFEDKQKERYELQHITYMGVKVHPSEINNKSVTKEKLNDMKMNSYGQEEMFGKYTDDVLIDKARYYVSQCSVPGYPCSTYDEALIHKIVPELIKRLEESQKEIDYLNNELEIVREIGREKVDSAYELDLQNKSK